MALGLFLLEVSFAWSLDEVLEKGRWSEVGFWMVRNGSRFSDFFYSLWFKIGGSWSLLASSNVALLAGVVQWVLPCLHLPWCLGDGNASVCWQVGPLWFLFTRTCVGFNTSGGVRRISLTECEAWPLWFGAWRSLVLRQCQTIGFYVSLDTCFLGFSRWWPFCRIYALPLWVVEYGSLLLLSPSYRLTHCFVKGIYFQFLGIGHVWSSQSFRESWWLRVSVVTAWL